MTAPPTPGQPRLLRLLNDPSALDLLLELGPLSRVQICDLTGLSKPTASRLLARLEDAGLVSAVGTSSGGPGRNAVLYAVHGPAAHVAAVNVTPRRITARIADLSGAVLAEETVTTRTSDDRAPPTPVHAARRAPAWAAGRWRPPGRPAVSPWTGWTASRSRCREPTTWTRTGSPWSRDC